MTIDKLYEEIEKLSEDKELDKQLRSQFITQCAWKKAYDKQNKNREESLQQKVAKGIRK